ncbi:MAG: 3-hydroxyacyl-CoA dehydrogenase NAD-binding domain-containing protein [Steroidobacteraceae bacterium]
MSYSDANIRKIGSVAVITVGNPPPHTSAPGTTVTATARTALNTALDELQKLSNIKAVVLMCEVGHVFSGADIDEAVLPSPLDQQQVLARLEQLQVPVVAAMRSAVMDGGLEFALACHYRVAAPNAHFAFLAISLGLIPGAATAQRLPRIIGVEKTLELILDARPVNVDTALEWGLVDARIEGDLLQGAMIFAEQLIVDGKGPRRSCEFNVNPSTCSAEILDRFSAQASAMYPNRMAPFTAIKAVRSSLDMPFEQGLASATELADQAKASLESRGAVHVFRAEQQVRRIPGLPLDTKTRGIKRGGIVGAGAMGSSLALGLANAGIPVVLLDTTREALDRGLSGIDLHYESLVKRGRLTAAEKDQRMSLIIGSLDYVDLQETDVVVEAVYEDLELKRRIFKKLEQFTRAGTVLVTTTSTLDINRMAGAARVADVVGMYFAAPANIAPILEVVRTAATSTEAVRTVMDLARSLRKLAVLIKTDNGFIGQRMMQGYAREAQRMVLEGAVPRQVDSVLEQWGMSLGILASADLTGLDASIKTYEAQAMRSAEAGCQADVALYEAGRLGQKNGKGYYRYEVASRTRHDDVEVSIILKQYADKLGIVQRQHTREEIIERCLYPLLNEGLRLLEEGVVLRAGDINVVLTAGYGFPRYRGGPMFYLDTIGAQTLLDGMLKYRRQFDVSYWQPAQLLLELVEAGQTLDDWQRARQ